MKLHPKQYPSKHKDLMRVGILVQCRRSQDLAEFSGHEYAETVTFNHTAVMKTGRGAGPNNYKETTSHSPHPWISRSEFLWCDQSSLTVPR